MEGETFHQNGQQEELLGRVKQSDDRIKFTLVPPKYDVLDCARLAMKEIVFLILARHWGGLDCLLR